MLKPESQLLLDAFDNAAQSFATASYEATEHNQITDATEEYIAAKDALIAYIQQVELVEYLHRLELDD